MPRTRVGCCGLSGDFTVFSLDLVRSILAGQHDHPVLLIPAGVEGDRAKGRDCAGNLLTGVLMAIATLLDHRRAIAVDGLAHLVCAEENFIF